VIAEPARKYCEDHGIPLWLLWEVEHGDYQLVVTLAPENLKKAKNLVADLHCIGRVSAGAGSFVELPDGRREVLDLECAQSLLSEAQGNMSKALTRLIQTAKVRGFP
jgi:hypothetical protein